MEWVDLAEDIKDAWPIEEIKEQANFHMGVLGDLEIGSKEDSRRWLVTKAGELGIM